MHTSRENIIEATNINFERNGQKILSDVSINIQKGLFTGIIGPNGAGKTSLLKTLLGIEKPLSGNINILGESINKFKDWHKIGYVAQKNRPENDFPATVLEVVEMPLKAIGVKNSKEKALRAISSFGLIHKKDEPLKNLSGGETQRVFLARALGSNPEILFLDEPTVGIDEKSEREFYEMLQKLKEEKKLSIIMISHDKHILMKEADVIYMINGSVICNCTDEIHHQNIC